ncbi:MAG: hypothetical protein V1842_01860, partial [Candidatus Omnitrophota bacterium]|nr:hypothetical protein [Candidatus Omnitrophota bacterium]MBU1928687.1 hypothetical protein [Candidatus Omnitrophota bacterium]MBU2035280.1 hypothetical protein [Candidatus Omnitrophota bacterium]
PWQLAKEKKPDLDKRLLMTPAVDLDLLLNYYLTFFAQGGKNVLTDPYFSNTRMYTDKRTDSRR